MRIMFTAFCLSPWSRVRCLGMLCILAIIHGAAFAATLPNFLFILVDDQSWSGTSVPMIPGKEFSRTASFHMPNVERLAAQGVVFSQAYAAHPKCECSRASIQMGRTTTTLNATDKRSSHWTAPPSQSLVNTLKAARPEYRAAHLGKWQWPTPPEQFGYDVSDGVTMNEDGDTRDPDDPKQSFGITRRANTFLEKQVREGHPFYLQLSYYAPHQKPQALESTLAKYRNIGGRDGTIVAAMTEDLDTCIGDVLKTVEKLNLTENTFIIYMSDNGGRTEVLKGGKSVCDEGGLRVPLIVQGPGVKRGAYCHVPVVSYDIYSTVLDYAVAGAALPRGVEGGSWRGVLTDPSQGKVTRPIDRMLWHHDVEVDHPQTAMRKGDFKLMHYWDTKEDFLYDLSRDLGEATNLARSKPEVVTQMLAELKAHVRAGVGEDKFAALDSGKYVPEEPRGGGKGKGKGRPKK